MESNDSDLDPLLITANFVTYMNRKDHLTQDGRLSELFTHLQDAIEDAIRNFGGNCDGYNAGVLAFSAGKERANADRCVICKAWISAQNRPDIISGLLTGAEHEGAWYCLDHLPANSDWGASLPWL